MSDDKDRPDWTNPAAYPDTRSERERVVDLIGTAAPGHYQVGLWSISIGPSFFMKLPPKP